SPGTSGAKTVRTTSARDSISCTHGTHTTAEVPTVSATVTYCQSCWAHHTAATENATDANWSMPSEPTLRMPSGENLRSTRRKTAAVGTPTGRIHVMPCDQMFAAQPSGKKETT